MKELREDELPPADKLLLSFDGAHNPGLALEREMEPFLQALELYAADWMPQIAQGRRSRRYSRGAVWKAFEEKQDQYGTAVNFGRTQLPALASSLSLGPGARLNLLLNLNPLSYFAAEDRCRNVVEVFRAWTRHYPVTHAYVISGGEYELSGAETYGRDQETWLRDGFDKIYDLPWLTVLGPKLVEMVGRQRVLSTPAHHVEELPHGAVLIVTWPIAAEFASDEARQAQARAFVHLRPDLDYDTVLRTLRERSAKLVPVEPHFHPDVAPLLWRIVNSRSFAKRQTKIAELNAYRPPEPEEWLPADAAPLSDVTYREVAIDNLGYLAEHLVALFHKKVPDIFDETPGSLTDIDFTFWRETWPSTFEREKIDRLVDPIGAYLGEVLVRNLGGEWVPRKKLEESQVRVGNRAWLPFVRAWRYMRSVQSLLDYSLTQLYREADRHRRGGAVPELRAENAVAKGRPDEPGYLAQERTEREAGGRNWKARHVADLLNISEVTVKRMARKGVLPAIKVGRSWEFPPEKVRAWAQAKMPRMGIHERGGRGTGNQGSS